MIGLDSYSRQVFIYLDPILIYISLWIDCLFEIRIIAMFPLAFIAGWLQGHWWGFISRNYVVWPTFLLMNVFIALKGSHFWFLFISQMRLFADDIAIYLTLESNHDSNCLQRDLDRLQAWELKWDIELNQSKCHVAHVTSFRAPLNTR